MKEHWRLIGVGWWRETFGFLMSMKVKLFGFIDTVIKLTGFKFYRNQFAILEFSIRLKLEQ